MEKHFALIRIGHKLRSLLNFIGCSAIAFESGELIYAYHKEPQNRIKELVASGGDISLATYMEHSTNTKTFSLPSGKLIFIEPSPSIDDCTLEFIAEELEGDIKFASIIDTVFQAGVTISSNLNLNPLLHKVMSLSEEILNHEVTAVILLDPRTEDLYWEVSRGDKSEFFQRNITLPLGEGIAGYVAQTGESVLSNDVCKDPRWNPSYDERSGFRTRSMICVPIKFQGKILGVIEAINKRQGKFTSRGLRALEILAAQTGGAVANARIHEELEGAYQELKVLDKARERVINHLSHELRTPLAIISGVLSRVYKKIQDIDIPGLEKTVNRGQRNLNRLMELQEKIDDILNERSVEETESVINIIEDAISFVQELRESADKKYGEILGLISERIDSLYRVEEIRMEEIRADKILNNVCQEAISTMKGRDLKIIRNIEDGLTINMDKNILKKVCGGLLKNAIEKTPDQGKIEFTAKTVSGEINIDFRDYGIGITPPNQKQIFGGFFHTRDTDFYTSKKPYEFNAGGTGSDLLRIKVFSERYGFSVHFKSSRCKFIPKDTDICPGKISGCKFIKEKAECYASGGSVFTLKFPAPRNREE
jgi:signal transduction histidine kinase